MLSLQTLTNIEALLMSRSHPLWGEFMPLAQTIGEVQAAKAALTQSRVRPAETPPIGSGDGVPIRPAPTANGATPTE
jgi:hypothetical protein